MKVTVDEILVRPGRREAEAGDVRGLVESMETPGSMNRAKGNNVSCTMQPTRKSFLDNTAEKPGVGWS